MCFNAPLSRGGYAGHTARTADARSQGFMLLSALFILMICSVLSAILVRSMLNTSASSVVNHISLQAGWYAESNLGFVQNPADYCETPLATAQKHPIELSGRLCELVLDCGTSGREISAVVSCGLDDGSHIYRTASKLY